jgi:hypothetical protein
MSKWNCAIIRSNSNQPIALVVLVNASGFGNSATRDAVVQVFGSTPPFVGLSIVTATQSGSTLKMQGDASLVGQLSHQDWLLWDWRDVEIAA